MDEKLFEIDLSVLILDSKGNPIPQEGGNATIRDMLLNLLQAPFNIHGREVLILHQLILQIADEKVSKVSLSKKRFDLLEKIAKANQNIGMNGQPMPCLIVPNVLAQVYEALGITEEDF